MRTVATIAILLFACTSLSAQETPEQSYQAFVDAVLDDELNDLERTSMFERYFDFEAWVNWQKDENDRQYSPDQKAQLREEWFKLFGSDEFRDTYRSSNVRVVKEVARDAEEGTAELQIAMDGEDGEQRFRVLMNLSDEGTHWCWYAIPRLAEEEPGREEATPEQRLREINEQLEVINQRKAELDELREQLLEEARRLRSAAAEENAGESPYASPQSVVETAWRAVEGEDAEAFVACHVYREATRDALESGVIADKLARLNERTMSWEVLDTTVDDANVRRARVRVKLKLQQTGRADERTITVSVRMVGEEWKIDEAP